MKYSYALLAAFLLSGCQSVLNVESTQPWEGHYYTKQQLEDAVRSINLNDGESIWMMSNHTLNRLLKYTKK